MVVGLAILIPALAAFSIPWLLNTRAGNRLVASRFDRAFAPGRLTFDAIRFSWFGPTRLTRVALDDPEGKRVANALSATLSPTLWELVTKPGRLGMLDLVDGAFEITRGPGGSIDVADALAGIFRTADPRRDLTIRAERATLLVHLPDVAAPVTVDRLDFLVQIRPAPNPVSWTVDLRERADQSIRITGDFDRWKARSAQTEKPDLTLDVTAIHWPVDFKGTSLKLSGRLDGKASVGRTGGTWKSTGSAAINGLKAAGATLRGDRLDLETVVTDWSIAGGDGRWSVERFDLGSALGSLESVFTQPDDPARPARVSGKLDLAAIARQLPHTLRLGDDLAIEKGMVSLSVVANPSGWSIEAKLAEFVARQGGRRIDLRDPASLSARVGRSNKAQSFEIADAVFVTPYGSVRADGRIDGLDGPANFDLSGSIAPDWKALTALLADRVEPGAKVSGGARAFHVRGSLDGAKDSPPFEADFGVELAGADFFGMSLGATPIVVRYRGHNVAIDPIRSTLNGGDLHLLSRLDLGGKEGATLVLEKGSSLRDAAINDEVSRRVLSFVAPILDQATRASGRVSMTIDRAEFPIASDIGRKANVTGSMIFQDVEFAPGPLARQLIGFVSRNEPVSIHLDEPVLLSIADGRVNQRGLAIPLGKVARVEVEGWVDFDKNLNLTASFPISAAMFPNRPLLGEVVAGAKIRVPIGGTLSAPKVDKDAFNAGMKDMGKSLLTRSVGIGALELLNQFAKPRVQDPDVPPLPRLSPEERKALRMERRDDRRRGRGLEPLPDGP